MGRWSRPRRSSWRSWVEASSLRQAQDAGGSAPIPRTGGLRGQSIASPRREAAPSARRGVPRTARRRVPAPGPADPPAAVLSVAHRDGLPSRILVVDDGSEDDLAACLGPELAAARNEGLEWAVAGGVPGCRRCLECGCGAALFRRRVLQGICGPVCAAPGHGFARSLPLRSLKRILDRQRDKQRSTIQQSFWGGSAGTAGSDCALLPRHHRAQVFYLRTGQMAWTPSPKMISAFVPPAPRASPLSSLGVKVAEMERCHLSPPLPPVHQRPGFRITGRHRNGGMTRGQDNPSLARDNART